MRIIAEILNVGGQKIVKMLLKICNAAWHQDKLPTYWYKTMINPGQKKGCKLTLSHYRPMCLISIPRKVFCKMILMKLDNDIDTHLSKQQFKYRKTMGAVNTLFTVPYIMDKEN